MATWQVGPTHAFNLGTREAQYLQEIQPNINSGTQHVQDGDRIEIDYANGFVYDTASWVKRANITIVGVGGADATQRSKIKGDQMTLAGFGKAVIYQDAPNLTLENLEIYNAFDVGAAGIRLHNNGLTIRNCYIHHCDDGILGEVGSTGDVLAENTEVAFTGIFDSGNGQSHGFYITTSGTLTARGCYFHHHKNGMLFKSKSRTTFIIGCRIHDETFEVPFESSQQVDIAWGGLVFMIGNSLQKGQPAGSGRMVKNNSNAEQAHTRDAAGDLAPTFVAAVSPGGPWASLWGGSADVPGSGTGLISQQGWFPKNFYAIGNTFVAETAEGQLTNIFIEDPYYGSFPNNNYQIQNNIFIGPEDGRTQPPFSSAENYVAASVPADFFWDLATRDYRLRRTATGVINQDSLSPTTGNGQSLIPTLVFNTDAMVGTVARAVNGALDRGMFEIPVPSVDSIGFNEFVEIPGVERDRWTCRNHFVVEGTFRSLPNPVGRSYSSIDGGGGKLWYFGGGHGSHAGNDVEEFDTTALVWEQQYKPEMPTPGMPGYTIGDADLVSYPTPLGRPYGYMHTYQRHTYDPRTHSIWVMSNAKLYRYAFATKAWDAPALTNGLSGPIECVALIFDSRLQKVVGIGTTGISRKVVQSNDNGTYTDLAEVPTALGSNEIYLAYDDLRQYILLNSLTSGGIAGTWWKFDATNTWTQLSGGPTTAQNSLWYDPVSQVIVIFSYNRDTGEFRVWTYDGTTFTLLPLGELPFRQDVIQDFLGSWNPLRYDTVRQCFWFMWSPNIGPGSFGDGTGGDAPGAVRTYAYRLASPAGVAASVPSGVAIGSVTPASGQPGQSLTVTLAGSGFATGATVDFGAGISVTPTVDSATQITCAVDVTVNAALGPRTVTVTNPDAGGTASSASAFSVSAAPSVLTLLWLGKTRDAVGQGPGMRTPDGAMDGCFQLINGGGSAVTITQATLERLPTPLSGTWNTLGATNWTLGAALTALGALINGTNDQINATLQAGESLYLFAGDTPAGAYFSDGDFRLTVTLAGAPPVSVTASVSSGMVTRLVPTGITVQVV